MRNARAEARRTPAGILVLAAALLTVGSLFGADQPLSQDDVTLLLLGGASPEKIISLVEQRGVTFQMNPDLAKKFHDQGASDEVIEALQKAGAHARPAAPSAPAAPPPAAAASSHPPSAPAPASTATAPAEKTPAAKESAPANTSAPAAKSAGVDLADPSPDQIQQIIREFATKEKLFKEARNNYTYHQINKVETLDADGNVDGRYQQEWDILYDDNGKRIERVTYAPVDTLKRVLITQEDIEGMRSIQPFVLTIDELPEYEVKYLGHVKVDEITAYVFSIRPKEIQKGRLYFQGTVWVDDRDLQIVKTQGKQVGEIKKTKNGENLFPRFTTYREQIDGKYWFPTFTMADDTLYFAAGPVHIRQVIKYTDYKQFKSTVKNISATPTDQPAPGAAPASTKK
ncbi:MAG TPA: hypothetical protein VFD30_02710 [Terriglobia bacterium]|nr:hypothetical protein [Terriglobia bacterium]